MSETGFTDWFLRGRPCHFLIIRLPHRWVVWLRQLVVMKNNERVSGQNLFNSYLHSLNLLFSKLHETKHWLLTYRPVYLFVGKLL